MLSIHPDALIWNQSFVFLSQNYDDWGQKILYYVFSQKMLKNMPILGVLHVAFILELVVRLAHKYGLGEKNVCCL